MSQEFLTLSKSELASICGGGFLCTCWNEDGTKTVLEQEATSAEHCVQLCNEYWKTHNSGSLDPTNP